MTMFLHATCSFSEALACKHCISAFARKETSSTRETRLAGSTPVVRRAKVYSWEDDGVDRKVTMERSLSPPKILVQSYLAARQPLTIGPPLTQVKYVERIEEGLSIFSFNFSEREMHAIFEAASGAVNVDLSAPESSSFTSRPTFPARVCVRACKDFPIVSLPESIFKDALIENYYSYTRFYFELDHKQGDELADLLMRQTIVPLRQTSRCEGVDRLSAPDTDVHVVCRESLTSASENIVCDHEPYGTCGLQSESTVLEKLGAQKLYKRDNYSTSLNSESWSIGYAGDKYDENLFHCLQCDYVPAQDDTITFRLEKVAGEDMVEAGTFSFHNASFQTFMSSSDENGDTPEGAVEDLSTNNAGDMEKIVDAANSVPFSGMENKERMQRDRKVDPDTCSHHPGLQEGYKLGALEGTTSFLPTHDKEDEQQSRVRAESDSLQSAQDEYANLIGKGCFYLGSKGEENGTRLGDIAAGGEGRHEQGEACTHRSVVNGVVQEASVSLQRGSVSSEVTTPKTRFREHKDMAAGSVTSQASGSESERDARAPSKSNYGAMFSWASEVTRFLSWQGQASRNVERRECKQFLGKLRRLKIMRDESQAQALVHQIQALRKKPAQEEEETLDIGESYEPVNEQLLHSIDGSEGSDREPSIRDPSLTMEKQEEPEVRLADQHSMSAEHVRHDGCNSPQRSQDEVQLWRSEWLKEAKWRLEDYEHMQNTMFLLENTRNK